LRSTFNDWYDKKMRATNELSKETDEIEQLLDEVETIAVVGISRNQHKDSYYVGRYLQNAGYKIIPVNPGADEILGEKAYPDLKSIPLQVDIVDVFIRPGSIPEVVNQALEINPKAIWLQLGTGEHPEQKERVERAGMKLIQSRCMKVDHQFLIRPKMSQRN
jgi:uncharacterized protein